ncbi:hypothetical protein F5Y01DRAFT_27414 [Xylaria sp. FL0043]|nr:hypothetical protein F5Y01DRAFT_27414 [Xylaria sp. FL0043]
MVMRAVMSSSERISNVSAFIVLIVGILNLGARYSRSAAFDRPLHFSVLVLAITGLVFLVLAKSLGVRHPEIRVRRREVPASVSAAGATNTKPAVLDTLKSALKSWLRSRSRPYTFVFLVALVVARTVLNWRIVRTIQCSWGGLYAFLLLFISICDHPYTRSIYLPRYAADPAASSDGSADDDASPRLPAVRFAALAIVWAFAVSHLYLLTEDSTGVICPAGWYIERFIPLAQLVAVFLDAIIITQVARLRQVNQDQAVSTWHFFGALTWTSAAVLSFLAVWSCLDPIHATANVLTTSLETRDLFLDSALAASTLVSGVYLLGSFHANLVSLVAAGAAVAVLVLSISFNHTSNATWSGFGMVVTGLVVFLGFGALLHLRRASLSSVVSLHREPTSALGRYCVYALVAFLLVFLNASFRTRENLISPRRSMAAGRAESDKWLANAMKSTSLESAIEEYSRRYGLPPPPHFDKWYEFAMSVNSSVIDAFDQINLDLLPFWAVSPALLRERTTHLLEHPSLSMGGLLIQDGQTSISPHVHGTHRWMVDVAEEMLKPFSKWLPDMQLAFNLDDECRIPIPVADMSYFMEAAQVARSRLQSKRDLVTFSQNQNPSWDIAFLDADDSIWQQQSDSFHVWSKSPIFGKLIAPMCPTDAPANQVHWWNRKSACKGCSLPHMQSGFVHNWTLSADLCHQPDLAHLHGFLTSPSALGASQSLFPVFSQAKVHGFADILYPSPWNFNDKTRYEEEKDVPWEQKLNSVYWRGASSDGFAIHGSWQMFLRARFVHLASAIRGSVIPRDMFRLFKRGQISSSAGASTIASGRAFHSDHGRTSNEQIQVNVSFVGSFSRCHGRDCAAEHATFYGSSSAEPPTAHDFQENWQHRHLVDLDGAGFSGRFLPFVQSGSLPYRAALFRTWWEERIHPWKHYVPLDLRLSDFWAALNYFGSIGMGDAKDIAEAGQQWAQKALRKEDMQVYMFRLLLEWGRIIDDRREDIGFSLNK